jgi:ribosomal protein L5
VTSPQGMNITMVTRAGSVERGRELLRLFGMPFEAETPKGEKASK